MTNMELYGTDNVPPVPKEVAEARIDLLQSRLRVLLKDSWNGEQVSYDIRKVLQAIDFWQQMSTGEENHA